MNVISARELDHMITGLLAASLALPKPLRWLMRHWDQALAVARTALCQDQERVWSDDELRQVLTGLFQARSGNAWGQALVALDVAAFGLRAAALDLEVWNESIACSGP